MIDEENIKIGGLYFIDLTRELVPCRYFTTDCDGDWIEPENTIEIIDNEPIVLIKLNRMRMLTAFVLRHSAFINVWITNLKESFT